MKTRRLRPLRFHLLFAWFAALTTSAQTDDTPTFELSPFSVEGDSEFGYLATNSVTGTRLATEIQNVPLNIEVVTQEFIRDTGSLNLREALRYSAGLILESQSDAFFDVDGDPQSAGANDPRGVTRRPGDSSTKLRGFHSDQILRDGFRRQFSVDHINIERVEVLRGPSALLYGVGNFGGVINFVPKRPIHDEDRYFVGTAVGSHDLYRAEFDFTGPLARGEGTLADMNAAYRLTGSYQQNEDHTQYYKHRHYTISPSLSFRPWRNTLVLFENEFGWQRQEGVGFQNIRSNVGDVGQAPSRGALWATDIYDPETSQIVGHSVDNRTFRWSGPDTYLKGPFRNHILDVEQRIGENALLKIGVGRSDTTFDSRQVNDASIARGVLSDEHAYRGEALYARMVDASVDRQQANHPPEIIETAVINYEWIDVDRRERRDQVRAEFLYQLDLDGWGQHDFILGTQYMGFSSSADQYGPGYSHGGNPIPLWDRYSFKNPTDYSPFVYGVQGDGLPDNPRQHLYHDRRESWDHGYYAIYQGQFFDEFLTLVGGVRHDRSDARESRHYIYESGKDPDELSVVGGDAPTATSPQAGISLALTEAISVFGVYSTGVVPNYYDRDGLGNIMEPTKAKNYEAGIKFRFWDGKLSGTVSTYRIERKNQPKFVWWAPSPYQSELKGYDPSAPTSTVLWYATPDAFWYGLHQAEVGSLEDRVAIAKRIWSSYWHPMIDEIAGQPERQDDWSVYGPVAASFWNWAWEAEVNTNNPNYTGQFYFPLANYSDPDVLSFMEAIHHAPGWKGNYYYTQGLPYRFGDGTPGVGNAPDGNGASVAMDDEANGWDAQLIFSPIPEFQLMLNYSYLKRKITTRTYQFVSAPYWPGGWWYASDNNYGTLNNTLTAVDVYDDVRDTTTYNQTVPDYGQSGDDSPEHTFSAWFRYNLVHATEALDGWTIGGGARWEDKRPWFTGFTGGGGNVTYLPGTTELVILHTKDRLTLQAFVEYRTRIADRYDFRVSLNVDNIADDRDLYGLIYAPGRTFRLFAGIDF